MKLQLRSIVLVMLVGIAFYGAFVAYSGLTQIRTSLSHFRWSTFAGALGLASANYALRIARWQYYLGVLRIRGLTLVDSVLIFLSGFVLTITPGKVGEVFKSAVLAETHDIPLERTASIVIAERLTDVIAIVVWIAIGSLAFSGGLGWALAGGAVLCLGLAAILWEPPVRYLLTAMERGRFHSIVPKLSTAYDQLRRLASPRTLLLPTLLAIVGWGLEGTALHLLLSGFGHTSDWAQACFFYATATLAGALIPVPGGLGVTEGLIQQQLVRVGGVAQGAATASMLLLRLATLWWAVLVGFVALGILKLRFPGLLREDTTPSLK